jgi:tripartite-type tricarboxylate transporter receptor subunit TctC
MKKPRTEEEKSAFIELRKKRDKISSKMKEMNPEELKTYIAERLDQKESGTKKNKAPNLSN